MGPKRFKKLVFCCFVPL